MLSPLEETKNRPDFVRGGFCTSNSILRIACYMRCALLRATKVFEPKILAMRASGKTRREIADELGLNKIQIKNWINRHNKEAEREGAGLPPKRRGRRPAVTLQEYKYENKRLKMKNELLQE